MAGVDPRKSLAVTDTAIVNNTNFALVDVLDQLAAQSGIAGLTGTQLFQQLWDTQNPSTIGVTAGPHCSDGGTSTAGKVNGFAYNCRRSEGTQATTAATSIAQYNPIGLFNRFDLAPANGSDCGEYRIVYAKTPSGGQRNFIIFEAVLPNPSPTLGLEGCRPVTDLWSNLTAISSVSTRAALLQDFYFNGIPGFPPVIHPDNYGAGTGRATGQVRVNEFITPSWMLREFKLRFTTIATTPPTTTLFFVPVTDKTNPFGGLFNNATTGTLANEFRTTFFPSQVASLAVNDINAFNYAVPDKFNSGQSDSQSFGVVDDYLAQFGTGASTLRTNIQAQLTAMGSTLTPDNIVARAEALSCAGCHQRSNGASLGGGLTWPSSAGFVHNLETTETGPDGLRFQLSSALTGTFLPHRKQILDSFNSTYRKCTAGTTPLAATSDACVADVCAVDSHCCTTAWDSTCVNQVQSVCHDLICPASQGTCAHTLCSIGVNLMANCDTPPATSSCVANVCAADPFCCNTFWDEVCIAEAKTTCSINCD
ncbi:MAG: hypothetical protein QM820_40930 [Minicystis sp.]